MSGLGFGQLIRSVRKQVRTLKHRCKPKPNHITHDPTLPRLHVRYGGAWLGNKGRVSYCRLRTQRPTDIDLEIIEACSGARYEYGPDVPPCPDLKQCRANVERVGGAEHTQDARDRKRRGETTTLADMRVYVARERMER